MFFKGSRYAAVPAVLYVDERGREIPYKRLRLLPNPPVQQAHVVAQGERLDGIAYRYYRDPEQFWRIADANGALEVEALTQIVGRRLGIPLV